MLRAPSTALLTLGLLALSACNSAPTKKDIDKLDAELASKGGDADPALTSALEDQIMVDPSLSNQSNANAIRPADEPLQAPIPPEPKGTAVAPAPVPAPASGTAAAASASVPASAPTLGQLAAQQASIDKRNFNGCGLDVDYSMTFASRLPADLPLYPKARVAEAAGKDTAKCNLRAISYTVQASPQDLVNFYVSNAQKSGYSAQAKAENGGHVVAGTRGNAAYYVIVNPTQGGASADFVTNNGS